MTTADLKQLAIRFCDEDAMTRDVSTEGALEYRLFLSRFLVFVEKRASGDVLRFDLSKENKCEQERSIS